MSLGRNGKPLGANPMAVQQQAPLTVVTHPQFGYAVTTDPANNVLLVLTKPNGEQHVWPLGRQAASGLGKQLMAPSLSQP